ncbi:MAG: hypothetical protein HEQ35_16705 [Gloeotrichia echinulata IR180]|jgi:hypothetical protein|nr:hypothetical protein [Gloeotrichia echinulata DEX184]
MKKIIPVLLSVVLLTNAVACSKPNDKTSNNSSQTQSSSLTTQQAILPTGTTFETVLQQELSTGKNTNDERFIMRVKNSVKGGNINFKDAQIQGHLEDVVKAAKGKKASLHLVFDEIALKDGTTYPIDAALVNTELETKTKGKFLQNAGIILGGTVAGHFVGKKANIKHGGLAGGAAATAYVLSSPGGEVVLKKGTKVKLKLKSPLASSV